MVLELRNASKRYDIAGEEPFYAVRNVNVKIHSGEFIAIMGPSGSGKSTMMHLLGLLDSPTEGEVLVSGVPTTDLSDARLARLRNEKIGFVFQNFNLLPRTSALENIALPLMYGSDREVDHLRIAAEALQRVGMDLSKAKNQPNQLSGGQQQRIAIARAIVTKPDVVLADEPTGNLDSRSTKEILGLFQSLNEQGVTIILVTHEADVARNAHRILYVRDGQIEREELVDHPLHAELGVKS